VEARLPGDTLGIPNCVVVVNTILLRYFQPLGPPPNLPVLLSVFPFFGLLAISSFLPFLSPAYSFLRSFFFLPLPLLHPFSPSPSDFPYIYSLFICLLSHPFFILLPSFLLSTNASYPTSSLLPPVYFRSPPLPSFSFPVLFQLLLPSFNLNSPITLSSHPPLSFFFLSLILTLPFSFLPLILIFPP
jgi:hypothetical protein